MNPANHLFAAAKDGGYAKPDGLSEFNQGAAFVAEDDAGADDDQAFAQVGDRSNSFLPETAGFTKEVGVGRVGFFKRTGIGNGGGRALTTGCGPAGHRLVFFWDFFLWFFQQGPDFWAAFFSY